MISFPLSMEIFLAHIDEILTMALLIRNSVSLPFSFSDYPVVTENHWCSW